MNRNWTFIFVGVLLVVIIALCACEPGVPVPPYVAPTQAEDTVHLEGDSVTFNTYYGTGVSQDWWTSHSFFPGASIDRTYDQAGPALTRVPRLIQEGRIDNMVWALGLNDVYHDRDWTLQYLLWWTDTLGQKVPSSTCIVMVKPWLLPQAYPSRPIEPINELRAWMDEFASTHPNVILVDWKPILEANPQFTTDGVHILADAGGPQARDQMYRDGLAQCA